jgi:hypothetical protein
MAHFFICFSSKDEAVARRVVEFLEAKGLDCWISSRDVPPGQNYQETIVQALEEAKGVVFLFSEFSSASGEIKKELSLAGSVKAPVFPLRLSPITPSGALRYELATRQWIDLFSDPEQALTRLAQTIQGYLDAASAAEADVVSPAIAPTVMERAPAPASAPAAAPRKRRAREAPRLPLIASGSPEFEAIRALLARHTGPIARVLVERAASEARTLDEFTAQLAAHISSASDRPAFLQAVRARLAAKA